MQCEEISEQVTVDLLAPSEEQLDFTDSSLSIGAASGDGVPQIQVPANDGRPAWNSKLQYILAQVGFSVGLGNIWRFPYLCQKNGGGAYLIPYLILLLLIGIPLFFMELAVGQKIRRGSIGVWNYLSPSLAGIGVSSLMVSGFVCLYYNVIIGWSIFYFYKSFQYPLPWSSCPILNATLKTVVPECDLSSATTYFWYRQALNITNNITESGDLNASMTVALLGAWVIVCLAIIKGIASSGKVMYFSSLFPYVVLLCFLGRALTLKGSMDGIAYMFTPNLQKMLEPQVWREAATQVFFAMGLGFGGVIAFSSYNKVNNNCHRDAVLVCFVNFFTSILATVVVFAVLGFKANVMIEKCVTENSGKILGYLNSSVLSYDLVPPNMNLSRITKSDYDNLYGVIKSLKGDNFTQFRLEPCVLENELNQAVQGTGLAFIAFTEALTHFPGSPFWSVMFFLMLINLGLGSMIGTMTGIITPVLEGCKVQKELFTVVCCFAAFICGLIFVQRSGNYFVTMFDDYSAGLALTVVVILENVSVAWIYGAKRFMRDLEDMMGFRPYRIYFYLWKFVTPLCLIVLIGTTIYEMAISQMGYNAWIQELAKQRFQNYPPWAQAMCYSLMVVTMIPIPVVFIAHRWKLISAKANKLSVFYHKTVKKDIGVTPGDLPSSVSSPL